MIHTTIYSKYKSIQTLVYFSKYVGFIRKSYLLNSVFGGSNDKR